MPLELQRNASLQRVKQLAEHLSITCKIALAQYVECSIPQPRR